MKLAEAVRQMDTLKSQNGHIIRHLLGNVRLPEDEDLVGSISNHFAQYEANMLKICDLLKRINKTNSRIEIDGGGTVLDALAKRDCLRMQISAYHLGSRGDWSQGRKKLRQKKDRLSREVRGLEIALERVGWMTDLTSESDGMTEGLTKGLTPQTAKGGQRMKLAEALFERAELQRENKIIETRIEENVRLPEDEEPTETIEELFEQYEANIARLYELIRRINKTNCMTEMKGGGTITDAMARRDCLKSQIGKYNSIYNILTSHDRGQGRWIGGENQRVKYVRHADHKKLKDRIGHLSQEFRLLDTALQGTNWTVDLLE
jgi:ribosomal protein S9